MTSDPETAHLGTKLERFFARYLELEPEEATTLGVHAHDEAHRDPTEAGASTRADFYRAALADFEPLLATQRAPGERLDFESVVALAKFEVHAHDVLRRDLANAEWSIYPYTMASYARAQGLDVSARIASMPAFLAQREVCLREAVQDGSGAKLSPRSTVTSLAKEELPGAANDLDRSDPAAAAACRAHAAFLEAVVAPRCPEDGALGEEEYRLRLRSFGIAGSPAELVAEAREHLASMQTAILRIASELAGTTFRSMTDAGPYLRAAQLETLPPGSSTEAPYRAILDRVVTFIREHELFDLPPLELGMDAYPEGMRSFGAGTNWPAPLLDPTKKGQFVVHPDPAAHFAAWAAVFAIHEGIPGHFLQSAAFREAFGASSAPVRFFCVADNVAFPRAYMRPMTNIEGWAIYAEELLRERGFHSGRDELFAHLGHAIRALRVIGDVGLHTRTLDTDAVARTLMEEGGLIERAARAEANRYARLPLQSITYFVGQRQTERLRQASMRARPSATLSQFHAWLFAQGPVPPAELKPWQGLAASPGPAGSPT